MFSLKTILIQYTIVNFLSKWRLLLSAGNLKCKPFGPRSGLVPVNDIPEIVLYKILFSVKKNKLTTKTHARIHNAINTRNQPIATQQSDGAILMKCSHDWYTQQAWTDGHKNGWADGHRQRGKQYPLHFSKSMGITTLNSKS